MPEGFSSGTSRTSSSERVRTRSSILGTLCRSNAAQVRVFISGPRSRYGRARVPRLLLSGSASIPIFFVPSPLFFRAPARSRRPLSSTRRSTLSCVFFFFFLTLFLLSSSSSFRSIARNKVEFPASVTRICETLARRISFLNYCWLKSVIWNYEQGITNEGDVSMWRVVVYNV